MRRFMGRIRESFAVLFVLVAAIGFGVAFSPMETPHRADAQGSGPAQILQNQGSCSGVAGSMFVFYFSTNPVHYTQTFDRAGNVGLCPQPTGPAERARWSPYAYK